MGLFGVIFINRMFFWSSMTGNDELYPLWNVYTALGNSVVCFYDRNTFYACGGSGQDIPAREVLEIRRDHPVECVRIGYFGDEKTRVLYIGTNALNMKETMKNVGLPRGFSVPDDEVMRLFCSFRDVLRGYAPYASVALEQYIDVGCEEQLEGVLRKFVGIYSLN